MPSGIVLLDKPLNCTSQQFIHTFKKKFHLRRAKIGHTGTLDPLATGLLPLLIGEATKFAQYLLKAEKTYYVTGQLGRQTTTGDSEGEVIREAPIPPNWMQALPEKLKMFEGTIMQVPPVFSALKQNGVALYRLARAGKKVECTPRPVQIFSTEIVSIDPAKHEFTLRIQCGAGTYIRSLIEDLAEALSSVGHVVMLRREQVGAFHLDSAVSLETLSSLDEGLLPIESGLLAWSALILEEGCCRRLQQGQRVPCREVVSSPEMPAKAWGEGEIVRLYTQEERFLGLLEVKEGVLCPLRLLSPPVF